MDGIVLRTYIKSWVFQKTDIESCITGFVVVIGNRVHVVSISDFIIGVGFQIDFLRSHGVTRILSIDPEAVGVGAENGGRRSAVTCRQIPFRRQSFVTAVVKIAFLGGKVQYLRAGVLFESAGTTRQNEYDDRRSNCQNKQSLFHSGSLLEVLCRAPPLKTARGRR